MPPGPRITNEALAERIDAVKQYNAQQFNDIMGAIKATNENISDLNIKVGIQNGSVKTLQEDRNKHAQLIGDIAFNQVTCDAKNLVKEYHSDKKKNLKNPIVWISNNWVPILIITGIVSVIFMLFPGFLIRVWSIVSGTQLEIGI